MSSDDWRVQDPTVDVGVCTFRREQLAATLQSLAQLELPSNISIRVIVSDNDETDQRRAEIVTLGGKLGLNLKYVHAPVRNISIARNACLDEAHAPWIAFIDDDETADSDWLARLLARAEETGADAVFGPSHALYPIGTPDWMIQNDFHSNIPTHRDGTIETGYTSNVLIKRQGSVGETLRFRPEFGRTGGEDVDYFFRLHRADGKLAIAEDAVVREPVAAQRLSRAWLARRKMALGSIYGRCAIASGTGGASPVLLFLSSSAKMGYCFLRAATVVYSKTAFAAWTMRALFHAGVAGSCVRTPSQANYGQ